MAQFFGTNGIRGVFKEDFTLEFIHDMTLAIATYFKEGPILVGYDGRDSSPIIAKTICSALNCCGLDCNNAGLVPTPCLEFAVKELGYHPNQYARYLRGKSTMMIGMMIADISNPFYHPMVRAVQDVAFQHHYSVMIANSDHLREKELLFCEALQRRPLDGLVIIPYHLSLDELNNLKVRNSMNFSLLQLRMVSGWLVWVVVYCR